METQIKYFTHGYVTDLDQRTHIIIKDLWTATIEEARAYLVAQLMEHPGELHAEIMADGNHMAAGAYVVEVYGAYASPESVRLAGKRRT